MSKFTTFLLPLLLLSTSIFAQKQLVWGQDEKYPLYTDLDSHKVAAQIKHQTFGHFHPEHNLEFRAYLQPYAEKGDPLAEYLYAQTYDLFPFGLGTKEDAVIALDYYHRAAAHDYADAEIMLYGIYHYSFMGVMPNPLKAMYHLRRAIVFGDKGNKSDMLRRLAGAFDGDGATGINPEFPVVQFNVDSTIFYLEEALRFEPDDSWTLDFLASVYAKQGNYDKAAAMYLQSDNTATNIKVAEWYIRGEKVNKDVAKGLQILHGACETVTNMKQQYMGVQHPVHFLNYLYKCEGLVTKEQVGKYWEEHFMCP